MLKLPCCWVTMTLLSIVGRQVHDIEDLAKVGKDHKACPYYAASHFAGAQLHQTCPET